MTVINYATFITTVKTEDSPEAREKHYFANAVWI